MNNFTHEQGMALALSQAYKGVGLTAPNPPVGAVLIHRGCILASGWHKQAGQAHAEREIINSLPFLQLAPEILKESTLYVTLEPCSTQGRTAPCTEGIITSGIGQVVYGIKDPDKRHCGAADAVLTYAGVSVVSEVLVEPCRQLLRPFTMVQEQGRPWIVMKAAFSLDGCVKRPVGESPWLSSHESLCDVHLERNKMDAILIGGETLRKDNPSLTIRHGKKGSGKQMPWRVVITHDKSSLPIDSKLFIDEYKERTLVFENIPLKKVLQILAKDYDVQQLMVEGGLSLQKEFINANLIDEWRAYITPLICGGPYPTQSTNIIKNIQERETSIAWAPLPLKEVTLTPLGQDLCLCGIVKR